MTEHGAVARSEWLQRILDGAKPADAVKLIRELDRLERAAWKPWQVREDRLRWRDRWTRVAIAGIDAANRPAALAQKLKRRAASRTPASFGSEKTLLDRIVAASGGKALSERQIIDIVASGRPIK